MTWTVLAHGGAGSFDHKEHDGPVTAAQGGLEAGLETGSVLDAVVRATQILEDDVRFNAGTGSNLRFDGKSIEMDASVMTDDGRFGAVACIQRVKNPILVARDLLPTPHNLLAGLGATAYARARGYPDHDNRSEIATKKFEHLREMIHNSAIEEGWCEWDLPQLQEHWNFDISFREAIGPTDTVGAVAYNGERFAAALSTGGTISTLLGRVGDVPLIGCGLYAGPEGAVCVTGDGDDLSRARLSSRVAEWMAAGIDPQECVDKAIALFPAKVAVGLLVITPKGYAAGSNLQMAWGLAQT
jgi:beta-aspartyl-peptidase (threonine type)